LVLLNLSEIFFNLSGDDMALQEDEAWRRHAFQTRRPL
jgi:hypothetical protein